MKPLYKRRIEIFRVCVLDKCGVGYVSYVISCTVFVCLGGTPWGVGDSDLNLGDFFTSLTSHPLGGTAERVNNQIGTASRSY